MIANKGDERFGVNRLADVCLLSPSGVDNGPCVSTRADGKKANGRRRCMMSPHFFFPPTVIVEIEIHSCQTIQLQSLLLDPIDFFFLFVFSFPILSHM